MKMYIQKSFEIASQAHKGQTYGEDPYIVHLNAVKDLLTSKGASPELQALGILHDALEDVEKNHPDSEYAWINLFFDISTQFGNTFAANCVALMNDQGKPDYALILKNPMARTVKIADRIANIQQGIKEQGKPRAKYVEQHDTFCSLLLSKEDAEQYTGPYDNSVRVGARLSKMYRKLIHPFIS